MLQELSLLKTVLPGLRQSQSALARHMRISPATLTQIIKYGIWPRSIPGPELRARIVEFLREHGATPAQIAAIEKEMAEQRSRAVPPVTHPETHEPEDVHMLLRKQTLTREAKAHFRIPRDPFTDELLSDADVFVSDDIRYVRASMRQVAKHGGLLAVIAESGAGSSRCATT